MSTIVMSSALRALGQQPADDDRGARHRGRAQLVEVAALDVLDEVERCGPKDAASSSDAGSWNAA
jgi:hypothetical protein